MTCCSLWCLSNSPSAYSVGCLASLSQNTRAQATRLTDHPARNVSHSFASVKVAPSSLVDCRFATLRSAPLRSAPRKFRPRRSNLLRSASERIARESRVHERRAPLKVALERFAPQRAALDSIAQLGATPERSA